MPASPSMYVIALRQAAVLRNAGSYETRPSPSGPLILPSSVAWTEPSTIGSVYCAPVRLSTTVRVSALTMPPLVEDQSVGARLRLSGREPAYTRNGGWGDGRTPNSTQREEVQKRRRGRRPAP